MQEEQLKAAGVTQGVLHPQEVVRADRFLARYEFADGVDLSTIAANLGIAWLCNTPDHFQAVPAEIREVMKTRLVNQGWVYHNDTWQEPHIWTPRVIPDNER